MCNLIYANEKEKGEKFVKELEGKNPVFVCVIATTETAKIPGISAAGKYPEFTDYTPPADVELLFYGRCKCISGIPVTPEGIPTPAIITMTALKLANIPVFIVSGGLKVKPQTPFIDLGGESGMDIRTGKAVENVEAILQKAKLLGENLAKTSDYLVVGESIPGGTTTCLGVLLAMGYDAKGKVSSSMSKNPHNLKVKVVEEGFKKAGISFGALKEDPIKAISIVGDPMMPAFSGLVLGAAKEKPVLMAGGTQMAAILAILKKLKPDVLEKVAIGTTRWIIQDKTSNLNSLVNQIRSIPVIAANLNFSKSKYEGLKAYEQGVVKEGVGAGGAAIASILKLKGKITWEILFEKIEENYEKLVKVGKAE
jgi:uncharacterized protein (TIGR00303 family)